MAENIRDAIANPDAWPEWRLDLLRSDANFLGLYREESRLRAIVDARIAKRLEGRAPFVFLESDTISGGITPVARIPLDG